MAVKRFLFIALVFSVMLTAAPVFADGEFYVIAGGSGVGTKITNLPYTISAPGFYYLTGNLSRTSGDGITVDSNDVTIDLMGFRLSGSLTANGIGIINGRTNVEIRNGSLSGWAYGIFMLTSGANNRVISIRAEGNNTGFSLPGGNHLIKGCNASNNKNTGISLACGLITDCVASNNATGIRLVGPGNVLGNAVFNNSTHNLHLGIGVATAIMVDRNSAFGLNPNYYITAGTTGVVGIGSGTITNAGAP